MESAPMNQQMILELRYTKGLRMDAVSKALNKTVTWATTTLNRLREALRKCIDTKLEKVSYE